MGIVKGLPLQRPCDFFPEMAKNMCFPVNDLERYVVIVYVSAYVQKHACQERKKGHGQTLTPVLPLPLHMLCTDRIGEFYIAIDVRIFARVWSKFC